MKQSAVVTSYYKAYYLSKAGIEFWLSAIKHRGIGFEYAVNTGDALVRDNFSFEQKYSISLAISGNASLLSQKFRQWSGCEVPYTLSGGESFVIPLFRDKYVWWVAWLFDSKKEYENLASLFKNDQIEFISEFGWDVTFGVLILSGEELSQNGIFFKKWTLKWLPTFKTEFETYLATIDPSMYPLESQLKNDYEKPWLIDNGFKMYLLVSNSTAAPESFCVSVHASESVPERVILPTDTFFLQSQASFADQIVALDASYAQPIPGFLFTTYSSFSE